jgi:hypothetical protein
MSKRRNVGDIVIKRENAGFTGQRLRVRLEPMPHPEYPDYCILDCGDEECKEYSDVAVLDESNNPTGEYCYHVSECEMEDVEVKV